MTYLQLYREYTLHLDHSVPECFDLFILHVVLQLHLLQNVSQLIDVCFQVSHVRLPSLRSSPSLFVPPPGRFLLCLGLVLSDAHRVAHVPRHAPPALSLLRVSLSIRSAQLLHADDGQSLDLLTGVAEISQGHLRDSEERRNWQMVFTVKSTVALFKAAFSVHFVDVQLLYIKVLAPFYLVHQWPFLFYFGNNTFIHTALSVHLLKLKVVYSVN